VLGAVPTSDRYSPCDGHAPHRHSAVVESEWLESDRRTSRTKPGNRYGGQFLTLFFNTLSKNLTVVSPPEVHSSLIVVFFSPSK
jgi:hypothetical protein